MTRIVVGLVVLVAIVEGLTNFAPDGWLPLALVILGLVYGWTAIDAEDPTTYLAVTIAAGMAAGAPDGGVLNLIPQLGGYLDGIVDQVVTALYAGVVSILVARTVNRLQG